MKKILGLLLSIVFLPGCDELEEIGDRSPGIVYKKIDAEVRYNKRVSLDLNGDNDDDLDMIGHLMMENGKSHLYLQAKVINGSNHKIMLKENPETGSEGYWVYPFEKDKKITEEPEPGCMWSTPTSAGYFVKMREEDRLFSGLWKGQENRYLAFQTRINKKVHYGWVRVSHVAGEDQLTVEDMAYKVLSEKSISAGDK